MPRPGASVLPVCVRLMVCHNSSVSDRYAEFAAILGARLRNLRSSGTAPPARAVPERLIECLADLITVVEDVLGDHANGGVAQPGSSQIPPSIALLGGPPRVVLFAVAFDDEPSVDDEVDSSYPSDPDLQLHVAIECAQNEAHEGFGARLAACVDEASESLESPRKSCEDPGQRILIDQPRVKGAVERRDGLPRPLASHGLGQRLGQVRRQRGCC